MSMINCPECGKEISSKATSCPHCGCPIESPEVGEKTYVKAQNSAIVSLTLGIAGVFLLLHNAVLSIPFFIFGALLYKRTRVINTTGFKLIAFAGLAVNIFGLLILLYALFTTGVTIPL